MNPEDLTVIVPTKNEASNIASLLESLPSLVELIVVDASSDGTAELIGAVRGEKTTVLRDWGNIAQARQLGALQAGTEWLLFTDADMVFARDYFDVLRRIHVDEKTGGIMGSKHSRDAYKTYYRLFSMGTRLFSWLTVPVATGSNMIVRKRALLDAGGFDPYLSCSEDTHLMWEIRLRGWKVLYEGRLRVFERDHRRLEKGLFKKTVHSAFRTFVMFTGLLPKSIRRSDWGYWS